MKSVKWLTEHEVNAIRAQYPMGTRLVLDEMDDPYSPVPPGTHGSVDMVDGQGQLHMIWDNGRSLALIIGVDHFHRE